MKRLLLSAMALAFVGFGPVLAQGGPPPVTVYGLQLDTGTKTATATAGAATLNKASGKVTTEALTTAAGTTYTLTVTNSTVTAADLVFASVANGTNSAGVPSISRVTPGAGSVAITVRNSDAAATFNGTLVVSFISVKN